MGVPIVLFVSSLCAGTILVGGRRRSAGHIPRLATARTAPAASGLRLRQGNTRRQALSARVAPILAKLGWSWAAAPRSSNGRAENWRSGSAPKGGTQTGPGCRSCNIAPRRLSELQSRSGPERITQSGFVAPHSFRNLNILAAPGEGGKNDRAESSWRGSIREHSRRTCADTRRHPRPDP
jgi:hypothetical protein